jgi:hypothetical protein
MEEHNEYIKNKLPTKEAAEIAKTSSKILENLHTEEAYSTIRIIKNETESENIIIPSTALEFLTDILRLMGQGNTVELTAITPKLQLHQAAHILGVSKKYLGRLVDNGQIPYTVEDNIMIFLYEDVINYKQISMKKSLQAMEELANIAQEYNLGY